MPSFSWGGVFREGQWRAYRRFLLEERRDASKRELAILNELDRIGEISVVYAKINGVISEKRQSIQITPEGSSLDKLMSAYVALGGNPFDISMFLSPDDALTEVQNEYSQPNGGVSTAVELPYSYGGSPITADSKLLKFKPSRIGGPVSVPDGPVEFLISRTRKWISKEIKMKRNYLENRIIKLCDLREQLKLELEDMCWSVRGSGIESFVYDFDRFDDSMSAAKVVYTIDSLFRVPSIDGTVPSDGEHNESNLALYPNLIKDYQDGQEDNTAL